MEEAEEERFMMVEMGVLQISSRIFRLELDKNGKVRRRMPVTNTYF